MRKKTIALVEEWKSQPASVSELVQRVAEGETLRDFCVSKKLPYSLVAKWIAETPSAKAEYDAALRIWGDSLAQEAVAISDEQSEVRKKDGSTFDPDVARDKLRVETRLKLAGKLDRERYGEREGPRIAVSVSLGDRVAEIRMLEERLGIRARIQSPVEKVVEGETI